MQESELAKRGHNKGKRNDLRFPGQYQLSYGRQLPLHYVGGLKRNQPGLLFAVPAGEYHPLSLENHGDQTVCRTRMEVYGREHTAVIVHNPALEQGQLQGIGLNREKTTGQLLGVQQKLMSRANGEIKGRKKHGMWSRLSIR